METFNKETREKNIAVKAIYPFRSTGCSLNIVFFPLNVMIFPNSASFAAARVCYRVFIKYCVLSFKCHNFFRTLPVLLQRGYATGCSLNIVFFP